MRPDYFGQNFTNFRNKVWVPPITILGRKRPFSSKYYFLWKSNHFEIMDFNMIFILGCQNENLLISRLVFGLLNVIYHICIWTFRTLVSDLTLDKNIASLKFKWRNDFEPLPTGNYVHGRPQYSRNYRMKLFLKSLKIWMSEQNFYFFVTIHFDDLWFDQTNGLILWNGSIYDSTQLSNIRVYLGYT